MKYTDNLVLRAKDETALQGMNGRLTEKGRCYGMQINVEETKVMRISRESSPLQIMLDKKKLENVEYFNYFHSLITNGARCIHEIKSRIVMQKVALNRKKSLFTSKLDLYLRKKLVKCCIWSIALYGAETWTLRKVDQKYLERSEMWH